MLFRSEPEVVIYCNELSQDVLQIQEAMKEIQSKSAQFIFYKQEVEYYFPVHEILFFETDGKSVFAHTKNDIYSVKYKLFELENELPGYFMRIAKSTIVNTKTNNH